MAPNYSSLHHDLIQKIIASAGKKLSAAQQEFIGSFYALAPLNDLKELEPVRAGAIALSAHEFFQRRKGNAPAIRVTHSKVAEQTGHFSRTEVIAINNDTPFLVDSLTALFTSLGFTIHSIQHPILATTRDASGKLTSVARSDKAAEKSRLESLIYVELSALPVQLIRLPFYGNIIVTCKCIYGRLYG